MTLPTIREPMTLATDYVLGVLCVVWGIRLLRRPVRLGRLWGCALLVIAMGAFFGGTEHGLRDWFRPWQHAVVWKAATWSAGLVSFLLLAATGAGTLPRPASRVLMAVAGAKLAVYLWWMSGHDEFRYVVYDSTSSVSVVLAAHLWAWRVRRADWAGWIVAGVLVSLGAAAAQMSGFDLLEHFNHNDLSHVIMMAGLWLYWRGAREARSAWPRAGSAPERHQPGGTSSVDPLGAS